MTTTSHSFIIGPRCGSDPGDYPQANYIFQAIARGWMRIRTAHFQLAIRLFQLAIALSAFLLFLVQPIIAKQILPWFGGSASVWNTCLFFFQFLLLLGYVYAHALTRWATIGQQAFIHVSLLALSLVSL